MNKKRKRWMQSLDLGDIILRGGQKSVILGYEEEIVLTKAGRLLIRSLPRRVGARFRKGLLQVCIPGISHIRDKVLTTSGFSSDCSAMFGDCGPLDPP